MNSTHNLRGAINNAVAQAARQIAKELENPATKSGVTEQRIAEVFHLHLNDHITRLVLSESKPKGEL
jgi:hypothetical protein